jgi:hypothetical protein
MTNPKGSAYELDLLRYFRNDGIDAERTRLAGKFDEGDLCLRIGGLPYVLEAKNRKQVDLAGWCDEAMGEAINYSNARNIEVPHFAVVHKRRMHPVSRSFVTLPLHEYLSQIRPPF